jgi:predicted alpha/beta hydrolase
VRSTPCGPAVADTSVDASLVDTSSVTFTGAGASLGGTWFLGATRPTAVVVVAGGAGVPAHAYRHLARDLATHGAAVLTFDYRGVGASRRGDLRAVVARTEEWSADIDAALETARRAYPGVPLHAVAHSVGTFLLGTAPAAAALDRIVLLAPHTGYWGDYHPRWRAVMRVAWHVVMPCVTALVGYFPGTALGMGDDLPKGMALDWADRRHPDILHAPATRARLAVLVARIADVHAPTLALTVTDDAFATAVGARRLLAYFAAAPVLHEVRTPRDLGLPTVGHFGFLRRRSGPPLWDRVAHWLALDVPAAADAA